MTSCVAASAPLANVPEYSLVFPATVFSREATGILRPRSARAFAVASVASVAVVAFGATAHTLATFDRITAGSSATRRNAMSAKNTPIAAIATASQIERDTSGIFRFSRTHRLAPDQSSL